MIVLVGADLADPDKARRVHETLTGMTVDALLLRIKVTLKDDDAVLLETLSDSWLIERPHEEE